VGHYLQQRCRPDIGAAGSPLAPCRDRAYRGQELSPSRSDRGLKRSCLQTEIDRSFCFRSPKPIGISRPARSLHVRPGGHMCGAHDVSPFESMYNCMCWIRFVPCVMDHAIYPKVLVFPLSSKQKQARSQVRSDHHKDLLHHLLHICNK